MKLLGKTLLLASLALSACTVGPDYEAPVAQVPPAFTGPAPNGDAIDPARWWTYYKDPELTALIARAVEGNPDIAIAAARVRQAAGLRAIHLYFCKLGNLLDRATGGYPETR